MGGWHSSIRLIPMEIGAEPTMAQLTGGSQPGLTPLCPAMSQGVACERIQALLRQVLPRSLMEEKDQRNIPGPMEGAHPGLTPIVI